MPPRPDLDAVREFVLANVEAHPRDIVAITSESFGVSRQAIGRHIRRLIHDGVLSEEGRTRSKSYRLIEVELVKVRLENVSRLEEDLVWKEFLRPAIQNRVTNEVLGILEYGFTELFNNVIDHSSSDVADVSLKVAGTTISIEIKDSGVGVFRKIRDAFGLPDEVSAVWELVKGKLTTDPKRHSGEGLFFTARMFDHFELESGSLRLVRDDASNDWTIQDKPVEDIGTSVFMRLAMKTTRTCKEVFDRFADPERDDYSFAKTHFPVALLQYGNENLVSRSQAKRIIERFDRFREVLLDFDGVESIGQGFADEIFRVFKIRHPEVTLTVVRAGSAVARMIQHVGTGSF